MKLLVPLIPLLVFASCGRQKVKETFLIPLGFEGRIDVIFNQPDFPPVPVENGRCIYRVPKDGILVTSSKIKKGILNQEYYYVDNKGTKTKIEVKDISNQSIPDSAVIDDYGYTGVYGSLSDKNPLEYIESILVSNKTNDSIYNQKNKPAFLKLIMSKVGRQF